MPNYAFGIAGRDEQIARHDNNQRTKQQNINDLFNGLGVVAQALGAAHRAQQARADQGVTSDLLGQMLQNPEGQPGPQQYGGLPRGMQNPQQLDKGMIGRSPSGNEGPPTEAEPSSPTPWNEAIGQRLVSDKLANVGSLFHPQGRLNPRDAMQLLQMQYARQAQGASQAREEAKFPLQMQNLQADVDLKGAQATKALQPPAPSARGGGPETALWTQLNNQNLEYTTKIGALNQAADDLEAAEKKGDTNRALEIRMQTVPIPIGTAATPASLRQQAASLQLALNPIAGEMGRRRGDKPADPEFAIHGTEGSAAAPAAAPKAPAASDGGIEGKYLKVGPGAAEAIAAFKQAHGITGALSAEDEPAFRFWVQQQRGR